MEPNLSVLEDEWAVDPSTVRPVAEGIWYADRHHAPNAWSDVRHGLWWTHSGSHVISLAYGTGLHYHRSTDYETYVFRWPVGARPDDVCCHATRDEADRCALDAFRTNRWCYYYDEEEVV